jgi:exodeoxyribonuclease VII large subunit
MATAFVTLRDPDANVSLTVTCPRGVLEDTVVEGSRVLVRARPDFWLERGTLSLRAAEIRQVGLGELLAQLERVRAMLAAEGLFAAERKRPLPFWPREVGLITGRASAAERDVLENARRRMPGVRVRIESVATQGASAVSEIAAAVTRLDADSDVDVLVIARGGGSVEDLLPFSNETLLRTVSATRTPVVSAIGHESDVPLLDHVADVAASTPTDAAKWIVPDLVAETELVTSLRTRARECVRRRVRAEAELMAGLPQRLRRTVATQLAREHEHAAEHRVRARRRLAALVGAAQEDITHVHARIAALSPQATLERGYAVVQRTDGTIVRTPDDAAGRLRVRVARGEFTAVAATDAAVATTDSGPEPSTS